MLTAADNDTMQHEWMTQQPPRWTAPPPQPRQSTSPWVIFLLVMTVGLLLINLVLTVYVFRVAQSIVEIGDQVSSIFGG